MGRSRLPRGVILSHFPNFYLPISSVEKYILAKTNRGDENSQAPSISPRRGVPVVVLTEMQYFQEISFFFRIDRKKTRLRGANTGNMLLENW